jgi:UDP-glucose 4-epimerase
MRVLVTGGAGFIGSHLVERLVRAGHDLTVVDDLSTGTVDNLRPALAAGLPDRSIVEMGVTDAAVDEVVRDAAPEVIVHLAAQSKVVVSMRDPAVDLRVNVLGLVTVVEAARRHGVRRLVTASSGGTIYGHGGAGPRTGEDAAKLPVSFYGLSKHVADQYLGLYADHFGIAGASLALGNVYGPRQDPYGEAGVVAIFARQLATGRPCTIVGDGTAVRDYVHVADVVDAFARALDRGHGLINIGTGVGTSVRDLHRLMAGVAGVDRPPRHLPGRTGEVDRIVLDPGRARRELGWRATTSLREGVRRQLEASRDETVVPLSGAPTP